jgi:hypothetical protein
VKPPTHDATPGRLLSPPKSKCRCTHYELDTAFLSRGCKHHGDCFPLTRDLGFSRQAIGKEGEPLNWSILTPAVVGWL